MSRASALIVKINNMANTDTVVAIIKGYSEEKKLLTQSWLESGVDVRKEIAERIKEIDKILAGYKNPYAGSDE